MSRAGTIGVIADDLTGAAEIGAIGLRYGFRAELLVRGEIADSAADLVCIDSDSRSCGPEEAAALARSSAKALRRLNPAWIYKKVDSVLRGNVVAEVEAIRHELGLSRALLAPANPSFGRLIRDGIYYVRDLPIAETDFALDPEYPRRSSDVRVLLAAPAGTQLQVIKPGEPLPSSGIALGEVSGAGDLEHWASRQSPDLLCAGGAEFFTALLQRFPRKLTESHVPPPAVTRELQRDLFICGSISENTQNFVARSQAKGTPIFHLPHQIAVNGKPEVLERIARAATGALETQPQVILSVQLPRHENREEARQFALDLVKIAASVLARQIVTRVYAEGGATAAALVREMAWSRLQVTHEVAPGVATLQPCGTPILLTVKPGSYPGWNV